MEIEKKNESRLTKEEVKTLEGMQDHLKGYFNKHAKESGEYRHPGADIHGNLHTAAQGYAVITDILSRNREEKPDPVTLPSQKYC